MKTKRLVGLVKELLENLPDDTPVTGVLGQPEKTIGEIKRKGIHIVDPRKLATGIIYAVDYFVELPESK